ncbi:39S ribosomal protein L10, mitochondrial [Puma concolor]|uniref:Large ribosomal subunit protein uL10m n=1 Tax=Puma concolor TaxID=9696 RepID=A0A6P6HBW9_PUMCO|nr:39S ribosomal protein L10, mitochondrial [Puma concolor]
MRITAPAGGSGGCFRPQGFPQSFAPSVSPGSWLLFRWRWLRPWLGSCEGVSCPRRDTGLIRLLRREIDAVFRDNRMIAVCQNVALSAEDKLLMRHQLRKHKILMKIFPNQVLKPFLADSKYQNLLPLFVGHNFLLVSEEPKVKEMVRILKGVPFLPLLGGCIDDTILSRQGFINYSKLPSLALVQGELVGGLTCLMAQTHFLLQHQPLQLTALLDQYIRQQRERDTVVPASGQPDPPDPVPDS